MGKENEMRRHDRLRSKQLLLTSPISGRVTDINLAGMGIESREPLTLHLKKVFTFGTGKARMRYQGEARWCRFVGLVPGRNGEQSAVYRAGIAFIGESGPDQL